MAILPTDQAIVRFDANESLIDTWVNSAGTYTPTSGLPNVETIPSFMNRVSNNLNLVTSFNNRGAWTSTTAYAVNDLVSNSGTWYQCVVAHTSGATFAGDLSSKWRVYQGVTSTQLSATNGASMIGYNQGGTGAATITQQGKNQQVTSVTEFYANGVSGAVVDNTGVLDSTLGIQAAITATLSVNGGSLFFPQGTYKITSALIIPFATGWKIYGASRGNTTIWQYTDNTPIFALTHDLTHSWNISDLSFMYANVQPSTNTNAISIKMGTGAPTAGGFFNFQIERCTFNSGFRAIAGDATNSPAVWGVHLKDLVFGGTLSGAAFFALPTPPVGQPNINIDNIYINASAATEPSINISSGDNVTIRNVEFNAGSITPQMSIASTPMVSVISSKSEQFAFGSGSGALWSFPNSYVNFSGVSFNGFTGTGNPKLIQAGSGGKMKVDGLYATSSMTAGTALVYSADDIISSGNMNLLGLVTKNIRAYLGNVAVPRIDFDVKSIDITQTNGDTSVTLLATSPRVQYFNTTLTANRSIILPSTGLVDGLDFEVVRYAGTPGAFTLQVVDPLSGKNYTIASGSKGFARYRAVGTGEWLLMSAGILP